MEEHAKGTLLTVVGLGFGAVGLVLAWFVARETVCARRTPRSTREVDDAAYQKHFDASEAVCHELAVAIAVEAPPMGLPVPHEAPPMGLPVDYAKPCEVAHHGCV